MSTSFTCIFQQTHLILLHSPPSGAWYPCLVNSCLVNTLTYTYTHPDPSFYGDSGDDGTCYHYNTVMVMCLGMYEYDFVQKKGISS